jgi:hypothetical protein
VDELLMSVHGIILQTIGCTEGNFGSSGLW